MRLVSALVLIAAVGCGSIEEVPADAGMTGSAGTMGSAGDTGTGGTGLPMAGTTGSAGDPGPGVAGTTGSAGTTGMGGAPVVCNGMLNFENDDMYSFSNIYNPAGLPDTYAYNNVGTPTVCGNGAFEFDFSTAQSFSIELAFQINADGSPASVKGNWGTNVRIERKSSVGMPFTLATTTFYLGSLTDTTIIGPKNGDTTTFSFDSTEGVWQHYEEFSTYAPLGSVRYAVVLLQFTIKNPTGKVYDGRLILDELGPIPVN